MKISFYLLVILAAVSLYSCKGGRSSAQENVKETGTEIELTDARNFKIFKHEGFSEIRTRNPWDSAAPWQRYYLLPHDRELPSGYPEGVIVHVPLKRTLVYSGVHTGAISEFGLIEKIAGVCNADYMRDSVMAQRISKGLVKDCGPDQTPDIEKIAELSPDAIILSPYQKNDRYNKVANLGIPVIEMGDYMEPSPLGRAEWIRVLGLLFGCETKADSIFDKVKKDYHAISARCNAMPTKPKVLFDLPYGPSWDVPTAHSTLGQLINDAGGANPFSHLDGSGSLPLAPEKVLLLASDASVWVVRYFQDKEITLSELAKDNSLALQFEAYKKHRVYGCNTALTDYFETTPFHPERQLADLSAILHPEIFGSSHSLHYFKLLHP